MTFERVDCFDVYPRIYSDMCLDIAQNVLRKDWAPFTGLFLPKQFSPLDEYVQCN